MMKFRENEDAVSPVIGVILMVAITVILAAVIAAFVFGMSSDMPDTTKNVAISVKAATGNNIMIAIEGGSDLPRLEHLKVIVEKNDGSPVGTYYTQDTDKKIDTDSSTTSKPGDFTIGSTWQTTATLAPLAEDGSEHVIVIGSFNDGSEQKLVDTYL
ncbi:type IV pilin N-terminal domain-containing protein [Methanoculleus sp. UBA430]|uniref:type IV pilin N-terminal domain-containing protein n=1 Tax=Methanoculleus sp. UBA430 TaxID=1915511 RepID=UPI0025E2929B|nr:type IV pilin N-terminal domain-containing protein [Methanoculleus sp. UBA430]